ncbi:Uma2 family endonuclease [Thiotrichales bacterium HSG1]|nr:Uma2 family endonuclease [Thiotrichales bacterium HSG1]
MLDTKFPPPKETKEMPSLNHSYICSRILRQLFENKSIEALTELTIDIENGLTPDISVYATKDIQPNFLRDITKMTQMPILAIEVISSSQNIQYILEKSEHMVKNGIKAIWTIEPYTKTIFITTEQGEEIIHNQTVTTNNIKVDFNAVFNKNKE